MKVRNSLGLTGAAVAALLAASVSAAAAQSVVRIGMTAADIPKTVGQPDQGFEGNRFTGNTMYEGLTAWDLSSADKASVVIPGVATEWAVSPTDQTKWIFKLRSGVKFHDGSDFDADAVVWNVEKVLKQDAAHFDASQVGVTASRMPNLRSAKAIDKMTVELTTAAPDALLPINLTNLYMASPAHWKKLLTHAGERRPIRRSSAKQAWDAFARNASGTGPWKMDKLHAARAARTGEERRLLGCQARAEGRPHGAAADAGSECPHRRAAFRSGRLDREPGARRAAADQAARLRRLSERAAARVAVAVQPHRGLALERPARAQGREPVHRPQRHEGRPARRPDGVGDRHVRARPSVARQSEIPDQVRSGGSQEADDGSRLLGDQEAEGEDADLGVRLRPDAAAADERVRAAEPRANASSRSNST